MRQELDGGAYWRGPHSLSPFTTYEETHDCGATWTALGQQQLLACLGVLPPADFWRGGTSGNLLYAQTYDPATYGTGRASLCVSSDNAQSWRPGPTTPVPVSAVRGTHWFGPATVPNLMDGGRPIQLLMRSDDQGVTWQSTGLYSATGLFLVASTAHGAVMFAIATDQVPTTPGLAGEGLWSWDEASAAWKAAPPLPPATQPSDVSFVAANPAATNEIFLSALNGLFQSPDSGATWFDASNGLPSHEIATGLIFDPSPPPNRLYASVYLNGVWALDIAP